jgi:hypothetical protein
MSGLLRPVGPAPTQTYWARRALVFGPAASVLAIAVVLISNGTSNGSAAQPIPRADASSAGSPTTSMKPAKLHAKGLDEAMVPESGPGTYQTAKQAIQPTTSYGTRIRYDVRVEDGLPVEPDEAAVLIQGVLDDKRSWRGTRRWRFELTPVGQSASLLGADAYGSDLTNYRRYLVNHEFGHALGKHHVDCPGPGRLAPVMMQQTKGLGTCRRNPWPQASQD